MTWLCMGEITQHVSVRVWPSSLSVTSSRFVSVVPRSALPSFSSLNNTRWLFVLHFAYLLILWWAHGSISCFSNVIMVLWTWSTNHSSKSYFQFFWVYPNIELLDHEVTQFLIFWVISKLFPQHIVLPPTVQKDYNFFISLTTLVAFVFWLLF